MANSHHTISHNNHPQLQFPGWFSPAASCNHASPCPCDTDPITASILYKELSYVKDSLNKRVESGELSDGNAKAILEEAEVGIREDSAGYLYQEWAENCYTIAVNGEVKWVSHVSHLNFLDLADLDSMKYVRASVSPSSVFNEMLEITFEAADPSFPFPRHPDMPSDETWLYRMFDDAGILLYVGISKDAFIRFSQHSKEKPWIESVARWEREKHGTREDALRAEKSAIKSEHPLYNVVHNSPQGAKWEES